MIASIRGTLEKIGVESAVINVGGIGFKVSAPTPILASLGPNGSEVRLFIHTQVREDAIQLFGFAEEDELRLFEMLINVSGFGPKAALSMLSVLKTEELVSALASGNETLLTTVPGIGKKLAGRLILELKEKMADIGIEAMTADLGEVDADVIAALLSLGYSASEASRAIRGIPRDSACTVEEKIKLALNWFNER